MNEDREDLHRSLHRSSVPRQAALAPSAIHPIRHSPGVDCRSLQNGSKGRLKVGESKMKSGKCASLALFLVLLRRGKNEGGSFIFHSKGFKAGRWDSIRCLHDVRRTSLLLLLRFQ